MRKRDKLAAIKKANILFEQRCNEGTSLTESPKFGGQNVSQEMKDELEHDKVTVGKAMADAFATPEGYEMKNDVEIGGSYYTDNGDEVKVVGETPEGHIKVVLTHGEDTVNQYKQWGAPAPAPLKIAWSKLQFDTIMGDMGDQQSDSQYNGETHGY